MNSESNRNFFSFQIRILLLFVLFVPLLGCISEGIPEGVPRNAKYDRKRNLYNVIQDSVAYSYFKDGKLFERCPVNKEGKYHGFFESFSRKDGRRISWGNFKNGQRDGEWTWTFEDGTPYIVQSFAYGKKKAFWLPAESWGNEHGEYKRFFYNGKLEEKGNYDSGLKDGSWIKYHPNGKLEYRGQYLDGKKTGGWEYYYPSGIQEAMEEFDKSGNLVVRLTYYPNGDLWCKVVGKNSAICKDPPG